MTVPLGFACLIWPNMAYKPLQTKARPLLKQSSWTPYLSSRSKSWRQPQQKDFVWGTSCFWQSENLNSVSLHSTHLVCLVSYMNSVQFMLFYGFMNPFLLSVIHSVCYICVLTDPEHHRFFPRLHPPQEPGRRDHPAERDRGACCN